MAELRYDAGQDTIQDIISKKRSNSLNLEPGFQRQSVWTLRDRKKLIDSIIRGYPLPAIFLYKRQDGGRLVYDVIDGKQRLESILMFAREMRGKSFSAKVQLPGEGNPEDIDYRRLQRRGLQHLFNGYKLQVIELEGDVGDIVQLFIRINSTGKALTSQEKRHANYANSVFLSVATKLANSVESALRANRVIGDTQVSRMKHIELVCELMLSMYQGDVINKKAALDHIMKSPDITAYQVQRAADRTRSAISKTLRVFKNLRSTRFTKLPDFYSLAFLISRFREEGLVLDEKKRNAEAQKMLLKFSNGVDRLREEQKKLKSLSLENEVYRDYLLTVLEGTDAYTNRRKRHDLLRNLLEPIFARKDLKRGFTSEQRRLLWNSTDPKKCFDCGDKLTWNNFTIDHTKPHSLGGRTDLKNAKIFCRSCNSSKGNRRRARRRAA